MSLFSVTVWKEINVSLLVQEIKRNINIWKSMEAQIAVNKNHLKIQSKSDS